MGCAPKKVGCIMNCETIGSLHVTVARNNLSAEQVLRRYRVGIILVLLALNVGHIVQVGTGLGRQRTCRRSR